MMRLRLICLSASAILIIGGCASQGTVSYNCDSEYERAEDLYLDAVPEKPGSSVNRWSGAMRCSAATNQYVIERNSWFNGGHQPGPDAAQNLQVLADRLKSSEDHVLVESHPVQPEYDETLDDATVRTMQLDTARRLAVVAALEERGLADADSRVHLGPVQPIGARGIEAPRVFNQLFFGGNRRGGNQGGRAGGFGAGGGLGGGGLGGGIGF